MGCSWWRLAAACSMVCAVAGSARAQQGSRLPAHTAAGSQAAAAAGSALVPPDIIKLKDGGMMRGTIVELIPGKKVVVLLPTGATREIAMSDVQYAGPVDEMPHAAPPREPASSTSTGGAQAQGPPTVPDVTSEQPSPSTPAQPKPQRAGSTVSVQTEQAHLHLQSAQSGLTFYLYGGTDATALGGGATLLLEHLQRLCTAPCDAEVPVGSYKFGLALGGDDPTITRTSVDIRPGTTALQGSFESRKHVRVAGLVTGVTGLAVGLPLLIVGINNLPSSSSYGTSHSSGTPLLISGAAVMGLAIIIGAVLGFQPNLAQVTASGG